jgi:PTS system nitrogen regulatory IIA component
MQLSDILAPQAVKVLSGAINKKRLFQELGEIAAGAYRLDAHDVTNALQEREASGPTGVGHGVALPHTRLSGLDLMRGVFLKLEKPIDFASVDRLPVDLIFALFAPFDSGVEHLKALALVSRTLREAALCAKLRANADPATLHALLTEASGIKAA